MYDVITRYVTKSNDATIDAPSCSVNIPDYISWKYFN